MKYLHSMHRPPKRIQSVKVVILSFLLSSLTCQAADLAIESIYSPKCVPTNVKAKGTILLRNTGNNPIQIENVAVSGEIICSATSVPLSDKSGFLWCNVWPTLVAPGSYSELKYLTKSPTQEILDATAVLRYSVAGEEQSLDIIFPHRTSDITLTLITFDETMKHVWFGLESAKPEPVRLASLVLNGVERIDDLIAASPILHASRVTVIGVPMTGSPARNDDVYLDLTTDAGDSVCGRVRIDTVFNITAPDLQVSSKFGLDNNLTPYAEIMQCPTHAHGTEKEAALKLAQLMAEHRAKHIDTIGYVYPCKAGQEEGLGYFSPLADATLTNTQETLTEGGSTIGRTKSCKTAELSYMASVPNPWLALISLAPDPRLKHLKTRSPTSDEIEHQVWECIGCGAKGILYRGGENDLGAANVAKLNRSIREYLPELRYAIPIEMKDFSDGKVHLSILQAGVKELILIFTNNTLVYSPEPGTPSSVEMLRNVETTVTPPVGFSLVNQGENLTMADDGTCIVRIPRLKFVHVVRIPLGSMDIETKN